MPDRVMDVLHLTVLAPGGRPDDFYDPIRAALADPAFAADVATAVAAVVRSRPDLAAVRVSLAD